MEIGTWNLVLHNAVPTPSHDGQRTWVFDPFERKIRTNVSLVLSEGYCDLVHDDERGFDCQVDSELLLFFRVKLMERHAVENLQRCTH